jgi:hypothetical protein
MWQWQPLLPSAAQIQAGGGGGGGFLAAWTINSNSVVGQNMKKNVASQLIGIQMVDATDGSAFTGAVVAYVTGDAGTQAQGSVGSGACTHEGNGFHTYTPAQAETNYDHIAFTFIGTGAVPATVQVFTTFPQTGDSFARLGAPAGASVSADIAAIEAQTDDIGAAGAGLTALASAADLTTLAGEVALVKAKTDNLPSDPADASVIAGRFDTLDTNIATIDGNVDAILVDTGTTLNDKIDVIDGIVDAIKLKTDNLPSDPADASVIAGRFDTVDTNIAALPTATENADALLNRDMSAVSDTTARSPLNALRAIRNKVTTTGGTLTVTKEDDTTEAWTAALTTDGAAEPITGVDPA